MPLKTFLVEIRVELDVRQLAHPTEDEIQAGEDEGLGGNQHYRDLQAASWEDVRAR